MSSNGTAEVPAISGLAGEEDLCQVCWGTAHQRFKNQNVKLFLNNSAKSKDFPPDGSFTRIQRKATSFLGREASAKYVSPDSFTHSFDSCPMVVAEGLTITSDLEQKWA